jgi:hypothetical protein
MHAMHAGTPADIGSGNVLSSTALLDHAEKAVLHSPFRMHPRPLVLPGHTNLEAAAAALARYAAAPGLHTILPLLTAALRSQ